jgi:hypothetical protein
LGRIPATLFEGKIVKKFYILATATILALFVTIFSYNLIAQQPLTSQQMRVLESVEGILKEIGQIRGLSAKSTVKSGFKSRQQLYEVVVKEFDEELPPEKLAAQGRVLARLGLVPKGFRFREEMIKVLQEQVGGFYDPKRAELYLIDDGKESEAEQRIVMAHELMHAIQDQNFNLRRFEKFPNDQGDQELAIQALIEGEATIVMFNYLLKPQGLDLTKSPKMLAVMSDAINSQNSDTPALRTAPSVIRETLIFPYLSGASFIQKLVEQSSWQKVSQAYQNLPESTEQILHPEKYLQKESPVKVTQPDLAASPGKDWKSSDIDVLGEFTYYLILSQFLSKSEAQRAAAGWGGDQAVFYDRAVEGDVIVLQSTWDTEKDATELFNAYISRTQKRYSTAKLITDESNLKVYETTEGQVLIEQRQKDIVIVEGATAAQLKSVRAQLWPQSKPAVPEAAHR